LSANKSTIVKYLLRLLVYLLFFGATFSVVSVVMLRFVPVTVTPLKVERLLMGRSQAGFSVRTKWVPIRAVSDEMVTAVVATEDNNFMKHPGFDFEAIRKALEESRKGRRLRGASTISQQTAKNVFCLPDRSWVRKGIESWFTVWIELIWGKKRIMEVYLNVIETHAGTYGVGATAEQFYDKPAAKLNRYEAAMIAPVLPTPLRMNLAAPSSYMNRRAGQVRRLMANVGPIEW
jgi:monofunctional biosynthetic peptidoglycan transglycosylase